MHTKTTNPSNSSLYDLLTQNRKLKKQLQDMIKHVSLVEKAEKKKLAGDLHDYLAQLLVLSKIKIRALVVNKECESVQATLREVDQLLNKSLRYTRNLVADLYPPILLDSGFVPALQFLAEQMKEYDLNVELHVLTGIPSHIPEELALHMFQMTRELLFNVLKHSQVKDVQVQVSLSHTSDLVVIVQDRGVGFASQQVDSSKHHGLRNIQKRMEWLGGRCEIVSAHTQGTQTSLILPL